VQNFEDKQPMDPKALTYVQEAWTKYYKNIKYS